MAASVSKVTENLTVRAYVGDSKTLLAFDMPKARTKNLVGFTIECKPGPNPAYYLQNTLTFASPERHAQVASAPANASINAPFRKFRWLHVPGSVHQGLKPFVGVYAYTITPRYVDSNESMLPLDPTLSVVVNVRVQPFEQDGLKLGFTRGYTQSQAFVNHFGLKALIRPAGKELQFDTTQIAGTDATGKKYSFDDEYAWSGFTARQRITEVLDEVYADGNLVVDVFAYDLNEPYIVDALLGLAGVGRTRVILDNAALHHDSAGTKPEDQFEALFAAAAKEGAKIMRGRFARYSHDKVFVVRKASDGTPVKVLSGSTNFSVTGMYVNSNHVMVFNDPAVADEYAKVFDAAWADKVQKAAFLQSPLASEVFPFRLSNKVQGTITFSPHSDAVAKSVLDGVVQRVAKEGEKGPTVGSVLFAVMEMDNGVSPVYTALNELHEDQRIFSYGVSDNPKGIALYAPGNATGVLVTGKPAATQLPPPFNKIRNIGGVGHQIHHKFVVCGFNGDDPTVYCGSSNLALGGEKDNGDNLICLRGEEIATVFALEAISLVDHFQFLDKFSKNTGAPQTTPAPAAKTHAAAAAGWSLGTNDTWVARYFDSADLKCVDRELFAART